MNEKSKHTLAVHAGRNRTDVRSGLSGAINPATAYDYEGVEETFYPRYFNTVNQQTLAQKIATLEHGEDALVFSSGMAAILTTLFAFLKKGDHAVFQKDLYGGTYSAIVNEFPRYGIGYSFTDLSASALERSIRPETRLIYVESPSNPTLQITDLAMVASVARSHGIPTAIDNTFASPINQNPVDWGIDMVLHSGTKYIGGHNDVCCGFMVSTHANKEHVRQCAMHFGGALDARICYLVERSLKTIALRVHQQNDNAMAIAQFLVSHPAVSRVMYPGLSSHPLHETAGKQMVGGFGGMLSFEVKGDANRVVQHFGLIQRAVSLGGVESTACLPSRTSHAKMDAKERAAMGINDGLIRLSTGIEDCDDLIIDIRQALDACL